MRAYGPALATMMVAGLALGPLPPAGAVGEDAFSAAAAGGPQDPGTYGWRNVTWAVDTVVTRRGAHRTDAAPGHLGMLLGKKRASARFELDLPKACRTLRVRVKPSGHRHRRTSRSSNQPAARGPEAQLYDPVTTSLELAAGRLPDSIGRPTTGSRRFIFRVKDVTPPGGTVDYKLGLTFGGFCPKR